MKEILLDLMCELNPDEVNDRAQQLSSTIKQADEVEAEKKSSQKHYKDQLEALGGSIRRLGSVIRNRAESRPVTCAVMFHSPANGTKRIVRKDTGEIVRDEAMSAFEMQNNLFGEQDEPEATELPLEDLAHEIHEAGLTERVLAVIDQPPSKPSKRKGKYTPEPGQE